MTVSSDTKSLDSNLTEAILRCSIFTSIFYITKHFLIVSLRLMYFVPTSFDWKLQPKFKNLIQALYSYQIHILIGSLSYSMLIFHDLNVLHIFLL